VSLDIIEQDSIGIVGESGSGKSSLVMAILQLLPDRITKIQGKVYFKGNNLLELTEKELSKLRWKEIAAVFQKSMNSLSPVHKIGNQMSDIYQIHEKLVSKKEIKKRMINLLK